MTGDPTTGTITTDDAGNVTIGLPVAVSFGEAIIPDGEGDED